MLVCASGVGSQSTTDYLSTFLVLGPLSAGTNCSARSRWRTLRQCSMVCAGTAFSQKIYGPRFCTNTPLTDRWENTIYIYMCVWHIHIHIHLHILHIHIYIYTYIHKYIYTYIHIYIYIIMWVAIYTYVHSIYIYIHTVMYDIWHKIGKEITWNHQVFAALGISRDARDADVNEDQIRTVLTRNVGGCINLTNTVRSELWQFRASVIAHGRNNRYNRNRKLFLINQLNCWHMLTC